MYTFESMCDFQYVPLKRKTDNTERYVDLIPSLIPTNIESSLHWYFSSFILLKIRSGGKTMRILIYKHHSFCHLFNLVGICC